MRYKTIMYNQKAMMELNNARKEILSYKEARDRLARLTSQYSYFLNDAITEFLPGDDISVLDVVDYELDSSLDREVLITSGYNYGIIDCHTLHCILRGAPFVLSKIDLVHAVIPTINSFDFIKDFSRISSKSITSSAMGIYGDYEDKNLSLKEKKLADFAKLLENQEGLKPEYVVCEQSDSVYKLVFARNIK